VDLELTGKRAVVTGGSRGIGLAVAKALAAEGADVALLARDKAALEAARETVAAASGRRVLAVSADTGDDESVRAAVRAVVEGLGGVDILVNAAARPNTGAVTGIEQFDADQDRVTGAGGPGPRSGCGPSGPGRRGWGARRSCRRRPPHRRGPLPR